MEKYFKRWFCVVILGSLVIAVSGCGGANHTSTRYRPLPQGGPAPEQGPPPAIDILITVRGWEIVQHRFMSNTAGLGDLRFAGRFLFLDALVFKLKAEKVPDWYWLVRIPSVEKGMYEIRAKPYREYSQDLAPMDAPERFKVSVRIENQTIRGHYIVDPDPRWGYFQVSGYRSPVLYLKNEQYPGRVWAARLPREDGTWTIYISLIK